MINIIFTHKHEYNSNIENICNWYIKNYLRIKNKLTIIITPENNDFRYGTCIKKKLNYYLLKLNYRNVNLLTTLIHELIHISQFYSQKLKTDKFSVIYLDRKYDWSYINSLKGTIDYQNLPWENEANILSKKLYLEYIKTKNESDNSL